MDDFDVKALREKLRLTQEELAQKIGVSRNTIINYEKGGVIPESKRQILNVLWKASVDAITEAVSEKHVAPALSGDTQGDSISMPREVFDQITRLTETVLSQQRTIEKLAELQKGGAVAAKGVVQKAALG